MDNRTYEVISEYAMAVKKQYNPKDIYLYGSHARGEGTSRSDIDIAVIINPTDTAEYMGIFEELYSIAAGIDGRIEPNLLMDNDENDKYSFLHEVKSTGKSLIVN